MDLDAQAMEKSVRRDGIIEDFNLANVSQRFDAVVWS